MYEVAVISHDDKIQSWIPLVTPVKIPPCMPSVDSILRFFQKILPEFPHQI